MDKLNFRRLLLRCAVFAMACDGEVHQDEVAAIKEMAAEAPYFADLDAESEVQETLGAIKTRGMEAIEQLFKELSATALDSRQEKLVYEVLLRVTEADGEIRSDEKRFLQRIKDALGTEDRVLVVNFPTHLQELIGDKLTDTGGFSKPLEIPEVDFSEDSIAGAS